MEDEKDEELRKGEKKEEILQDRLITGLRLAVIRHVERHIKTSFCSALESKEKKLNK